MSDAANALPFIATLIAERFAAEPTCVTWDDDVTDLYEGEVEVYAFVTLGGAAAIKLVFDACTETFEAGDFEGMEWDADSYELGEISPALVAAAKDWAELALTEDREKATEQAIHERDMALEMSCPA